MGRNSGGPGLHASGLQLPGHHAELRALGAPMFGLSTQAIAYQQEMVQWLHNVVSHRSFA